MRARAKRHDARGQPEGDEPVDAKAGHQWAAEEPEGHFARVEAASVSDIRVRLAPSCSR
jgi:hypothetical protein